MANKSISELSTISSYSSLNDSDLFVLQHNNQAMSLQTNTLKQWLLALANGHGGIKTVSMDSSFKLTITFADGTTWSTSELTKLSDKVDSSTTYTNTTPTLTAHGGVEVGETFDNVSVKDMFDKILYPWVAPSVSLSATGITNGGVYEKGTTQTLTKCSYTITKKSHNISSGAIYKTTNGTTTTLHTITADNISTLNSNGNLSTSVSCSDSITQNTSLVMKVVDAKNKTTSSNTISVTFVYPYYYGVISSNTSIIASVIKGLTKSVATKGSKTVSYTADNQLMVFAYPASYGKLSKITDPNNFNVTDTFSQTTVSVTGTDGTAQSYYVYTSNTASTVSGFKMIFSY